MWRLSFSFLGLSRLRGMGYYLGLPFLLPKEEQNSSQKKYDDMSMEFNKDQFI